MPEESNKVEEEFTQEEIATLKQVASAFNSAVTVGELESVSGAKLPSDLMIEVFVDNASRKANLGDVIAKSFVPLKVDTAEAEDEVEPMYVIAYDDKGEAHLVSVDMIVSMPAESE